tara:strand:+ start:2050 stop:3501 length:1452 start_codon:yes stop_codon:yes gene_type:complete
MGSAAGQAIYSQFSVFKQDRDYQILTGTLAREVDLKGKIVGFNYYESLYSPMVTASFVQLDTGGTVGDIEDNFAGTFKDGLKIEGFEKVKVQVRTSYSSVEWDLDDRQFVITGSPYNVDTNTKQSAYFPMVSVNAITAASKPVPKNHKGKISAIVGRILRRAGLPHLKKNIEETENTIKIDCKNENPIDTILQLCPKAKPVGGDPGYFFFENHEGFNFKSIHGLIRDGVAKFQDAGSENFLGGEGYKLEDNLRLVELKEQGYYQGLRHTYVYKTGLKANLDNSMNDFNVLTPPTVRRDQDIMNALKNGQYNVRICTQNIATGEVKEQIVNLFENVSATLGTDTTANADNSQIAENNTQEGNYCKTYTYVLNPGDLDGGDSTETSTDAHLVHPKAVMRYQLLHAQLVNILVPHNAELTVGEIIRLNIENITQDDKIIKEFNQHRSGYYMILHLCHSFSTSNSFTSLTLVRDEYGYPLKLGGVQK